MRTLNKDSEHSVKPLWQHFLRTLCRRNVCKIFLAAHYFVVIMSVFQLLWIYIYLYEYVYGIWILWIYMYAYVYIHDTDEASVKKAKHFTQ